MDVSTNGVRVEVLEPEPEPAATSVPPTPGAEQLDPIAKKVRNLNKKVSVAFGLGGLGVMCSCHS